MKLPKVIIVILVLTASAQANDWQQSNLAIVEKLAVPGYQSLVSESKTFTGIVQSFCKAPSKEAFSSTQKGFHQLMDAWQGVQQFRLGPAESFMRHFRIQMWPDRSNAGAKQMARLKKEADFESLSVDVFTRASTAVQGLPAVERLLFTKDVTEADFNNKAGKNYNCALLSAISKNILKMSEGLLADWRETYKKTITTPSEENDYFETHKEVASQFLKEFATELQAIVEQKFNRSITEKYFRGKRAESWRSQRSLRNILINIKASHQFYKIAFAGFIKDSKLDKQLDAQFLKVIAEGEAFDKISLADAYSQHKTALTSWQKEIDALKDMVMVDLPPEIDLNLGFNSLDGD